MSLVIAGRVEVVSTELAALRAFRLDVLAVRSEAGHITQAEIDEVERRYQERTRA